MARKLTITITAEIDDSTELAQLGRAMESYNEGACDDVVFIGFGGVNEIFRLEGVSRLEYVQGPGDEDDEEEDREESVSASLM